MRAPVVSVGGCFVQTLTLAERFWMKVDRRDSEGCWIWLATSNRRGNQISYGKFKVKGKTALAHRVAWEVTYGEIPEGLLVLHHCDNPRCVNPGHLFLGTGADNSQDAIKKGRLIEPRAAMSKKLLGDKNPSRRKPEFIKRGAELPFAKFDEATVREIRIRHQSGESMRSLGRSYGVVEHDDQGHDSASNVEARHLTRAALP